MLWCGYRLVPPRSTRLERCFADTERRGDAVFAGVSSASPRPGPLTGLTVQNCDPGRPRAVSVQPSITIRDVPDAARDELAARAAASGRSLQQYLRGELIRLAAQPDTTAILERARERVRVTGEGLTSDQILDFIDAGRSDRQSG